MLKLTATLFLLLGGTGVGYARSRELTEREKKLDSLLQFLFFLKGEIRCGNSSLPDAFREIAGKMGESFACFLKEAAQEMEKAGGKDLEEILKSCIQRSSGKNSARKNWSREELEFWQAVGSRLGYLDREMQLGQIELMETELEVRRRQLREKLPEQRKICQALGILGGILLAVLFW